MQHFIYASFTAQVSGVCQPKYETVQTLKSFSGKHCWQRRRKQWKEAAERKDILKVVSLWADDGISDGMFLKHAKCHFSLKGFDFSHCLSAQCSLRDDHSITSRLWTLGVHPEGSPDIALISATPSKTWWALLSVFLSRRGVSPLSSTHLTPQPRDVAFLPDTQGSGTKAGGGPAKSPSVISHRPMRSSTPRASGSLGSISQFITWQISKTFRFTQSNRKRISLTLKFPLHGLWHVSHCLISDVSGKSCVALQQVCSCTDLQLQGELTL